MKSIQQAKHDKKPHRFSFTMANDVANGIKNKAGEKFISRSLLMNQILRDWLKKENKNN